ncbi:MULTISPECIES: hypothetical protein [Burkholderia]|uniref:hypothetical protein n=1 Tax=Burkholderia TaxID=32008 RepID=UPI00158C508D|nr:MULTISPECIES: hypothetical protein [Burkholderia]
MDVAWFLNRRLDFIRQLYASSSAPFVNRRIKIENKEEPFVPPYSEDPEPAFMLEWQDASDSTDVLAMRVRPHGRPLAVASALP